MPFSFQIKISVIPYLVLIPLIAVLIPLIAALLLRRQHGHVLLPVQPLSG
jgi:hypothetical protein